MPKIIEIGTMLANKSNITIGILTDVHYAERDTIWSRYFRDSLSKVRSAISFFNQANPDFCVYLGDNIDKGPTREIELEYLMLIKSEYAKFNGIGHYVIGNHDLASFSKEQFLKICGSREKYYSFDYGPFHFIILDGCYNQDESDYDSGNFDWRYAYIPKIEQEWLIKDLQNSEKKAIIFVHQRLDDDNGLHGIGNSKTIRQILEDSGKVIAVFQGHDHFGAQNYINDINYFTFQAVVEGQGLENNSYSLIHIWNDGTIKIEGFGKQNNFS
ncbi:TPA: alkaline phosphatase [Candidatus Poribacteria bacterium]|nr:alkaline phosphatase [Candidatus Poribacteria bacterium]